MGSVRVEGLGKAFRQYPSRWARLLEWVDPRGRPRHALRWVLRGVTFAVAPGEAVGIVGVNGAGKSTLLKLITGTMAPTEGGVRVEGRVAALLELGLGFHPEFTGRQNAVLSGQLLGLSAATMRALLPQIAEFAEIGAYFDEPVRVYSSGMQVRLAFAVATAVRPDVLIVDEALSVGDAYFQHKCFARIREFRAAGTTLLFVSHDSAAILGLCDRAVLLHGGRVARQGGPQEVLDFYNALLADPQGRSIKVMQAPGGGMRTVSGSGQARLVAVRMTDEEGVEMAAVPVGARVCLEVEVEAVQTLPSLVVGYAIRDRLGQMVFGTNTAHLGALLEGVEAGARVRFCFEFVANLGPGSYAVSVAAHAGETHVQGNYEWRDVALVFEVVNAEHAPFLGLAWLPPKLSVEQVNG